MSRYAIAMAAYGVLSCVLGVIGGLGLAGGKPSPASFAGVGIGVVMIGLALLTKSKPGLAYRLAALLCVLVAANPQFFRGVIAVLQGQAAASERWVALTMVCASIALFVYLGLGHMASKKKAS
jgi:hypothetical protein